MIKIFIVDPEINSGWHEVLKLLLSISGFNPTRHHLQPHAISGLFGFKQGLRILCDSQKDIAHAFSTGLYPNKWFY